MSSRLANSELGITRLQSQPQNFDVVGIVRMLLTLPILSADIPPAPAPLGLEVAGGNDTLNLYTDTEVTANRGSGVYPNSPREAGTMSSEALIKTSQDEKTP